MRFGTRALAVDDIEAVQALDQEAHGEHWSRRTMLEQIAGADRYHMVVTHRQDIVAHGALWFDGSLARITNVAIAAEFGRRGLGSKIMRTLCDNARTHVEVTAMSLEVAPANHAAQALYRRFGFVPVRAERSFYGPGRDALVMAVDDVHDLAWVRRIADTNQHVDSEGAVA